METVIHLDTHVVVWLYTGDRRRLKSVWKTLERSELVVSPILLLELQYLYETGRTTQSAEAVFDDLLEQLGLRCSDAPFPQIVHHALQQTWTRDPFDRLIVGNALVENAPLLTRDDEMQNHCPLARWK